MSASTQIIERPILYTGAMVRAILNDLKTKTRRIIKPQPDAVEIHRFLSGKNVGKPYPVLRSYNPPKKFQRAASGWSAQTPGPFNSYGHIGDLLWVRETFASNEQAGIHPAEAQWVYRATDPTWGEEYEGWKWKPSIFMPRKASRITLEITGIIAERLQDITDDDALAEGIGSLQKRKHGTWQPGQARDMFAELWKSINGADSWDANPWVWVIEFKRLEPQGGVAQA